MMQTNNGRRCAFQWLLTNFKTVNLIAVLALVYTTDYGDDHAFRAGAALVIEKLQELVEKEICGLGLHHLANWRN